MVNFQSWKATISGDLPTAWGSNSPIVTGQGGRPRLVKAKGARATEAWLAKQITKAQSGKFPQFHGAVRLTVTAVWPHTKNTPKRDLGRMVHKITKPDGDNMLKSIKDVLQDLGLLVNDAQVSDESITRFRGPNPGLVIQLYELTDYDPFQEDDDAPLKTERSDCGGSGCRRTPMQSKWRRRFAPVIAEVIRASSAKTEAELRREISDEWPLGERVRHPYKMWLKEVREQLALWRAQRGLTASKPIKGGLFASSMEEAQQ